MVNDSSLRGAVAHSDFDFESQKGITILLASLRAADLTKEQKNEIRDLVFEYTSGGRDETTRLTLEQKIKSFSLQPVAGIGKGVTPEKQVTSKQKTFGMSRPAPKFSPASVHTENAQTATVQTQQPVSVPEPVTPAPVPGVSVDPKPEPALTSTPQPAVVSTPTAIPQESPVSVTADTSAAVSPDADKNLARIKEIKSLVNERVGNPVNLVDINNEVGREYMGAMLEAMKKLNTGSAAVSAMQRLELAFAQVEKTLSEESQTGLETPAVSKLASESTPPPAPEPVKTNVESVNEQVTATIPQPAESVSSPAETAPVPQQEMQKSPSPVVSTESAHSTIPTQVDPEPLVSPVTAEEDDSSRWGPAADILSSTKEDDAQPDGRMKSVSVADNPTKLKTPADLPEASSLETSSVAGDPLFTKEIDEGLEQLLVEWPIFKKSGLFGTGPKGRQHPLFLKVAGLQIPLLLAGRFEGATQEIKQSITDYMNGWRYEQGIIYKQGENFEHYLRRVIRHILDLQNK